MQKKLLAAISILLIFMSSLAFSAFSTSLTITSEVRFRALADIRVNGVSLDSANGGTLGYESDYSKNTVSNGFILPTSGASISYSVQVDNLGDLDYSIYDIFKTTSDNGLTVTISGYNLQDVIPAKTSVNVILTYTTSNPSENVINVVQTFDFKKVFYVRYETGTTQVIGAQTKYEGVDLSLTSTVPTKTGYTFARWNTKSDGTGVNYNSGATYTIDDDATMYARYTLDTYTITYNLNNGTNNQNNPATYTYESNDITLGDASKTGYTFNGWTGNGTTTPTKNLVLPHHSTGNKTFTANFTANTYTINYAMNGGNNPSTKPTSGTYDQDVIISNPTKTVTITPNVNNTGADIGNATSANQTFAGWSATVGSNAKTGTTANPTTAWDGTATTNTYFKNLKETGTVTMTANWTPVAVTLPSLSKTGYTCKWYTDPTNGTELGLGGASYTPSANSNQAITAYARCTANTYTVTAKANGGSISSTTGWTGTGNTATKQVTYDSAYGTLPTVSRAGYTFKGWNGKNLINLDVPRSYPSSTTLSNTEARTFEPNTYVRGLAFNNYFNASSVSSLTVTSNSIELNGQSGYGIGLPIITTANKTYTLSFDSNGTANRGFSILFYKSDGTFISYSQGAMSSNHPTKTFTTPANTYYLVVEFFGSNASENIVLTNIQLEENSVATPYEPYYLTSSTNVTTPSNHEINAKWEIIPYTITYALNNGTVSPANPTTYNVESSPITLNNPTKTLTFKGNYNATSGANAESGSGVTIGSNTTKAQTFAGWSGTGIIGNSTSVTIPTGSTGNRSYTAHWTAVAPTSLPTVTRTGYTCGWSTSSTGTTIEYDNSGNHNYPTSAITEGIEATVNLYAVCVPNTYTIGYTMNGGTQGTNAPTSGTYDTDVVISKPAKTFTVNIDGNSQGATVKSGNTVVTSASSTQTFAGWTGTNINISTAKYGAAANPSTAWNGTTKIGVSTDPLYLLNLRSESGTVTMVANWTPVAVTLPIVEKTGYQCKYNTASNGSGTDYTSGGSYTPSATTNNAKLYVICSANTYNIAYVMNNGNDPSSKPTTGTYDANVNISNPTKTVTITGDVNGTGASVGSDTSSTQTFLGWSSTVGSNAQSGTSTSNYASWNGTATTNTYFKNLTNTNNATVTMTANWTPVAVTLPSLSKTGYICKWYSEATGGNELGLGGDSYTPTANSAQSITVYARCSERDDTPYRVNHYVHDLGTNTYTLNSYDDLTGRTNATLTLANLKKTISGFTYTNGYLTGNTTKPTSGAVTTTTILADGSRVINLYYRRNYLYVQYHVNGGTLNTTNTAYGVSNNLITSTGNTTPTNFLRGVYGSKVGAVNSSTYAVSYGLNNYNSAGNLNIEYTGYTAVSGAEWNTNVQGTGTSYGQDDTNINANGFAGADLTTGDKVVTIYVNWTPVNYTITYALNNGTVASANPTSYNIESNPITLNNPTKTLTFVGHYNATSGANASSTDGVTIGADTTQAQTFAGWSGTGLTGNNNNPVTLATGSTGNRSYTAHWTATAGTVPTVTRTGYTCGWNTSESGTTIEIASGGSYATSRITEGMGVTVNLYAVCTPNTYTVTAKANGGSIASTSGWTGTGNTATKSVTYDDVYGTLPSVSRTGYTFLGWNGKNLFISELENGSITNSTGANSSSNAAVRSIDYIPVESNTLYTISNDNNYANYVYEYDSDNQFIRHVNSGVYSNPYSFTTSVNAAYVRVRSIVSDNQNDLTTLYQLEEGSTATPYEPYYIADTTTVTRAGNHEINAKWSINNPATPTISGGTTKVYGLSATTLTCSTSTDYASGTTKYYSFGYASSDGGTPSNWTTASTSNQLSISATEYVGQRWYSCRVYASDGTLTTSTVTSAAASDTEMTINNAKLTFDTNSCGTINNNGTSPAYVKNGTTGVLTTIRGTAAGTIPTLSKTGYTFNGWYDGTTKVINADGTIVASVSNWTDSSKNWLISADKTLKASCTAKTYTLTINPQGGTYSGSTSNATKQMTYDATTNNDIGAPTRSGYTFNGWYTSANGGTQIYDSNGQNTNASSYWTAAYSTGKWKYDGDVTVYAKWTKAVSSLTNTLSATDFVYSGSAQGPSVTVKDGNTTLTLNTDYTVSGNSNTNVGQYAVTITGANVYNTTTKAYYAGTTTLTYYINNAKITWNANSCGTISGTSPAYVKKGATGVYTGIRNTTPGTIPTVSKTGYTFNGWYDGSTKVINSDKSIVASVSNWTDSSKNWLITADKTLTASCVANTYTVIFDKNATAATGTMGNQTFAYDESKKLTKNAYANTGYTFAGWNVLYSNNLEKQNLSANRPEYLQYADLAPYIDRFGGDKTYRLELDIKSADTTNAHTINIYCQNGSDCRYSWAKSVTVSSTEWTHVIYDFVPGSANTSVPAATLAFYGTYNTGNAPIVKNVRFGLSPTYADEETVSNLTSTANGQVTLYAGWTPHIYTVSYNGNGNTGGSTASSTHVYDEAKALTTNGFTRTGYTFAGWNTQADGSGTNYTNSQSVINLTSTDGATVTLYAKWSKAATSLTNTLSATDFIYNGSAQGPSVTVKDGNTTLTAGTDYTISGNSNTNVGEYTITITGSNVYNSTTNAYYTGTTTLTYYINNAQLTFDKGSCTSTSGTTTLYTKKGATKVYTGIRNTTEGSIPTASKSGYTFQGWYTASSGGSKVLNANGGFTGTAVTNYTNASSWQTVANQTLYAQCTRDNYTISYSMNNGTNNANNPSSYNVESSAITLAAPTKTLTFKGNYNTTAAANAASGSGVTIGSNTQAAQTFAGWTGSNGTTAQTSVTIPAGSTGDKAYTAHWTAVAPATLPTVTKVGYTCGWSTSSSGTTIEYQSGATNYPTSLISEGQAATVNLYAVCTPKTYTLTINPQGGTYNSTTNNSTKTMTYDSSNNNDIGVPTRSGYTFDGWYIEANSKTNKLFDNTGKNTNLSGYFSAAYSTGVWQKDANVTVYAHWSKAVTATTNSISPTSYIYDGTAKTPTPSVSDGATTLTSGIDYAIAYTNNTNVGTATATITGAGVYNATTKAYYTGTKSIDFEINNAKLTFNKGNCDSTSGTTLYTKKGATGVYTGIQNTTAGTIPTASKSGYTFQGWYTASTGGSKVLNANGSFTGTAVANYTNETSWQTVANKTLYAQCIPTTYTVTANASGGSISSTTGWTGTGNTATKQVAYNSAYGLLPTIARSGYTFGGWSLLPDGYTQVEYIQSTGTQYIATDAEIFNKAKHEIVIDFEPTQFYNYNQLYGSTADNDTFEAWIYSTGNLNARYNGEVYGSQNTLTIDTRYVVDLIKSDANLYKYVDGELITGGSTSSTTSSSTGTLTLFKSGSDYSKYKLYSAKIYANGELVRDYVPCINNSTGKAGLYDIVNGVFYDNSGTGEFTTGNTLYITSETIVKEDRNHNIYATWTPITYTVAYNGNGNTGGSTASSTHTYDTAQALTTNGFTKTGYTFTGWSTSASDKNLVYDNSEYTATRTTSNTNAPYVKEYTIAAPFASGEIYQLEVDVKGSGTLYNYFYGVQGYLRVSDWTQTDGTTTLTGTNGDGHNEMALTSSYKHYTVRFTLGSTGDGSLVKKLLFRLDSGDATAYVKNVRFFKVSSSSTAYADGQTVKNLTTTANGTVNLYAIWAAKSYTLTINPNGGTFNGTTSNTTVTQNYGTTYSVVNNPTRTGYVFTGWTKSGTGTYNYYDTNSGTPSDTTTLNYNSASSTLPGVYNNKGNGTVTRAMVADSTATGGYSLKITTNGEANPSAGGIVPSLFPTTASRIHVIEIKAKIPTGYTLNAVAGNSYQGLGSVYRSDNRNGTSDWYTYYLVYYGGDTGGFAAATYLYLNGSNNTSVTWYVDYITMRSYTRDQFNSKFTFEAGNGTLTANWAAGGSRISFKPENGTWDSTNVKSWTNNYSNVSTTNADRFYRYDTAYGTFPSNNSYDWTPDTRVISRTGYTFNGWYTAANGGTQVFNTDGTLNASLSGYSDANSKWIKYDENVTLYAKWTKAATDLTVTAPAAVIYNGSAQSPAPTVKDGSTTLTSGTDYTVSHSNNTNVGTATATITGKNVYNSTTKAYYSGTTTVTYYINNATLTFNKGTCDSITGSTTLYTRKNATAIYTGIRETTTTGTLPTASKTGYTFDGWYTASSGGSKVLNANGTFTGTAVANYTDANSWQVTANQTLYAQCTRDSYSITYAMNNGTNNSNNPSTYTIESAAITLAAPTKTLTFHGNVNSTSGANAASGQVTIENNDQTAAQTFAGWTGSNGTTAQTTVTIPSGSTGDKAYTAHWTAVAPAKLPKVTRTGYTCGWSTSSTGTTIEYASEATNYPTSAISEGQAATVNLYAVCTPKTYTLTINPQNGTYAGSTSNATKTMTYDSTNNNDIGTPTRSGYTFAGWYTAASGGTQLFGTNGQNVNANGYWSAVYNTGVWKYDGNVTVYAKWTKAVGDLTKSVSPTSYIYDGSAKSPTPSVSDGSTALTLNTDYTVAYTNNTNVGTATATFSGAGVYNATTKAYYTGTTTVTYYINNATLTFNENSCGTISGTSPAYVKKGATGVYTGIRNATGGTIPSVSKDGYTFNGWYDGNTKVINADGTIVASVSNWTDSSKNWLITTDKTLTASCSAKTYKLAKVSSGDTNLLYNGSFENYYIGNAQTFGSSHTWDKSLNGIPGDTDKAYYSYGWGTGLNSGVPVPEVGYHAHMRVIDNNAVFRFKTNEDYNGDTGANVPGGPYKTGTVTTGRWLGIARGITGTSLTAGKKYTISLDMYRVSGGNVARVGLYHASGTATNKAFSSGQGDLSPTVTGQWQRLSYTFTLSSNYNNAVDPSVYIYGQYGSAGEFYIDNVSIEEVSESDKVYDTNYTSTELTAPTKTGYTFVNWNSGKNTTALTTSSKFNTSNATFANVGTAGTLAYIYAKWTPVSTTMTINPYGGSYDGSTSNSTKTMIYDSSANSSIGTPTRSGYKFQGWYTGDTGGSQIYNNSGNNVALAGYWNLASPNGSWMATSNSTIYARWSKALSASTITKTVSASDLIYTGSAQGPTVTVKDGSTTLASADYTLSNNSKTDVGSYTITISGTSTVDSTTKAYYTGSTTIGYNINNATLIFDKGSCTSVSGTSTLYTKKGAIVVYTGIRETTATGTIPTATKSGYTFQGWYTASTGGSKVLNANGSFTGTAVSGYTNATSWQTVEDKTLYARCSMDDYSITYSMNNGTNNANNPDSYTVTSPAITIVGGEKTLIFKGNYNATAGANAASGEVTIGANTTADQEFAGWSGTGLTGNNNNPVVIPTGSTGNRTYTAHWTAVAPETLPTVTRTGYTCGWNTSNTGTTIQYASGATNYPTSLISEGQAATVNLYAVCTPNTYEITYDYNTTNYIVGNNLYINTDYTIDWSKSFKLNSTINIPTLGNRYLVFGNYNTTGVLNLEINNANKIRLYSNADTLSSETIANNTDIATAFTYDGGTKAASFTTTGTNSNASVSVTNSRTDTAGAVLRIGTDSRTDNTFKTYTLKAASITDYYTYGTKLTNLPLAPTKSGYTFNGWYTAASGGTAVTTTTDVPAANTTYYAHWTANVYAITLNQENGSGGTATIYEKYNDGYYLNNSSGTVSNKMSTSANGVTVPTRSGYTFAGYYTASNGGTQYIDANGKLTSSASATQFSAAGNLYAHWTKAVSSLTNTLSATDFVYSGSAQGPSVTVKDGNTTLTLNTDYTVSGNSSTNVGEYSVTVSGKNAYNSTTKAYYTGTTTIAYYINNATLTFDATTNGGTISGTTPLYAKKGTTGVYTAIRGTTGGTIPTATKTGWTFTGWYDGSTKVINADGTIVASVSNWTDSSKNWLITADKTLTAKYTITDPVAPTVTGNGTRVYNYAGRTLTCATTTTYATGTSIYYEFGYATSQANWTAGTITWLGNASTTNTLELAKDAYLGTRYYGCRLYAKEGSTTSNTVKATSAVAQPFVNARLYFDATTNGGTIDGVVNLYVPYGQTNIYTGRTNTTAGTIPLATKTGYTFTGWYTAASGGTKIIASDRTVQASVSGWTSATKNWLRTNGTNDDTKNILYAQYTANGYTIGYSMNNGPDPSTKPTSGTYNADVVISNPGNKSITVTANANGTGATVGSATTGSQSFSGWTSSSAAGLGSGAKTGTAANPSTAWAGASTTNTYFRNLRDTSGTVTMTANWSGTMTLPTLTAPTGKTCKYYTDPTAGSEMGSGGATWTIPSNSATAVTAYVRCSANNYTLTINPNGGTYSGSTGNSTKQMTYGSTNNNNIGVPTRDGYTFIGWYTAQTGGSLIYNAAEGKNVALSGYWSAAYNTGVWQKASDTTIYARWKVHDPAATVSGGATKIYGASTTTLTCGNTTTGYASGSTTYYAFGYASTADGTPSSWTADSTTNTYVISTANSTEFVGTRYYKCRVYVKTGSDQSETSVSTATQVTINNAKLTFDANSCGTVSGTSPAYVNTSMTGVYTTIDGTTTGTVPSTSKSGYTFNGWYTASSGGTRITNGTTILASVSNWTDGNKKWLITADKTLYSQCSVITYNIGYTLNNGTCTGTMPATYTVNSSAITLPTTCTKTLSFVPHYSTNASSNATSGSGVSLGTTTTKAQTWTGWTGSNGTTAQKTVTIAAGSTGDKSYASRFTAVAGTLPSVTRDGYTCGWNLSDGQTTRTYSQQGTFPTSAIEEGMGTTVDLYAVCTANQYTVSFNQNGGSGGTTTSKTATYGDAMPSISGYTKPTKSYYTFGGYYDTSAASGGTRYYTAGLASDHTFDKTADTTLYARWEPNTYTIYYDYMGGTQGTSCASEGSTCSVGSGVTKYVCYGAKDSYTCKNVTTSITCNTASFGGTDPKPNVVKACYISDNPVSYNYDSAAITIQAPTREGYTFDGWQVNNPSNIQSSYTIENHSHINYQFVALWTKNQYTFDLNAEVNGWNKGNLEPCGYASIKINGTTVATDVTDWYQTYDYGSTWEVFNIEQTNCNLQPFTTSGTIEAQTNNVFVKYTFTSKTFSYNGGIQSFKVPIKGTYTLEVWGAQGGTYNTYAGGKGGYAKGNKYFETDTTLYIGVGQQATTAEGGYNGGGYGNGYNEDITVPTPHCRGGGGATHIGVCNSRLNSCRNEAGGGGDAKIYIVGAGGGGASEQFAGGAGGGTSGSAGGGTYAGGGGTQNAGGAGGYPNSATAGDKGLGGHPSKLEDNGTYMYHAGGGGGGWYGGGGGDWSRQSGYAGSGGGGSSYVSNLTNTTNTANNKTGNGQAKLTYVSTP